MSKDRLRRTLVDVRVAGVLIVFLLSVSARGTRQAIPGSAPNTHQTVNTAITNETYGKLPLYFQANRGQTASEVKFLSRTPHDTVFLTSAEAVLVLTKPEQAATAGGSVLRMSFPGADPNPRVLGEEELPGKANYFIGNDPEKWHTNVPTYAKVRYQHLYRGIDLVYYGNQRQLEYDFVVEPSADPDAITLRFQGAEKLNVDAEGDLVMDTAVGVIRMQKPFIYQNVDGFRQEISGSYVLKNASMVGFEIAAYDATRPLIIDPVLFYSTFLGGGNFEGGNGIAIDTAGNAYVTGGTSSTDFPTTSGAYQPASAGGFDIFVTKLNPTGSGLVYSTYIGGSAQDGGNGIAIDTLGNAYVTGATISGDFPTMNAFQSALAGSFDAFVTKLNSTGSGLIYSTYLGGNGDDIGSGIDLDAAGNAYIAGQTTSTNFPTVTPYQSSKAGFADAFVTKLNTSGSALVYSTYFGGGGGTTTPATAIKVDTADNAYITGITNSAALPTTTLAFQTSFGGTLDAFVTKFNPAGSGLVYSTYLGGSGDDRGSSIAVDNFGNAFVAGGTSGGFPTTLGAFQSSIGGGLDAFVTKLDVTGSILVYSTYLGGSGDEGAAGIALDGIANAYVTGYTTSSNFPVTSGAFQPTYGGGGADVIVVKLNPTGSALVYSSYLGGSVDESGHAIALDGLPNPDAFVTGQTASIDFPTTSGAFQTSFGGFYDSFVTKITDVVLPPPPTPGKVTGGGTINVAGGIGNFGFIVQAQSASGPINGDLQYHNHASGAKIHSVMFTSLVIAGNTATFSGTCTNNGAPCTFTVNVSDQGEPGNNDTFTISVSGGPPEGGTLRSGNIQIHR